MPYRSYIVSSHTATGAITDITTGTALKTVLQVNVVANQDVVILGWGCAFNGVSGTAAPGDLYLMHGDVAASVGTSVTPDPFSWQGDTLVSQMIGGAALTGVNFATEGTIASTTVLDYQFVHPQTGYSIWFPSDVRPRVGGTAARFVRIRVSFAASISCRPWIVWDE